MTLLGTLALGRKQAEARMTETAKLAIEVVTGDPDTLQDTVTETVQLASVPCRLKVLTAIVRERDVASQFAAVQELELHFPSGTVAEKDWVATILDSTADASLIGRRFRVKGRGTGGQTTASRTPVEEIS